MVLFRIKCFLTVMPDYKLLLNVVTYDQVLIVVALFDNVMWLNMFKFRFHSNDMIAIMISFFAEPHKWIHHLGVVKMPVYFLFKMFCSFYPGPCEPVTDGGSNAGSFTLCSQSNYTLHDLIFYKSIKTRDELYTLLCSDCSVC